MKRGFALVTVTVALALGAVVVSPPQPARAVNIPAPVCTVAGWVNGLAGTLCSVARHGGELLNAGGKLLTGHLGGAASALGAASGAAKAVSVAAVLAGIVAWVVAGGHAVLAATAAVIGTTTRPQLDSSWFSASYWRMAEIALLLTVPFLFAACVQAILRSDPSLIGRAALGYLPLAVLAISIAAPLTTLLLSASDGLSQLIAGASGDAPGVALAKFSFLTGGLGALSATTFIAFVIALITIAATLTLWFELLIRAAAVYVIVLMLPVFFAALVWPARRVWAIRSVEVLVALILSKFAIVAVLSLGAAAIGHGIVAGPASALAGTTLVLLAAFSPWALLRLLPLHELAAGVEGLRPNVTRVPLPELPQRAGAGEASVANAEGGDHGGRHGGVVDAARMVLSGLQPGHGGEAGAIGDERPTGSAGGAPGGAAPGDGASGDGTGTGGAVAAPSTVATESGSGPAEQRLPGMAARWQQPNGGWPVEVFGPEFGGDGGSEADLPALADEPPIPPEPEGGPL